MKHYKRFFALMLAGVLLLACAACGGGPVGDNPPTGTITTIATEPSTSTPSTAPGSKGKMNREVEKDGLVLRIVTDYQHRYNTGEPFTLIASITNTTERDIAYNLPSCTPDMHLEIQVSINGLDIAEFIDVDTYGKGMDLGEKSAVLKAGETFTEMIRFLPVPAASIDHWRDISLQEIDWFASGEYTGTAVFAWITGTHDNPGEEKQLQLEFPVVLIG